MCKVAKTQVMSRWEGQKAFFFFLSLLVLPFYTTWRAPSLSAGEGGEKTCVLLLLHDTTQRGGGCMGGPGGFDPDMSSRGQQALLQYRYRMRFFLLYFYLGVDIAITATAAWVHRGGGVQSKTFHGQSARLHILLLGARINRSSHIQI